MNVLGQAEELLSQLTRRLELRPHNINHLQPQQHREELRGFSHLLAQLARPGIDFFHFRGCIALGGYQWTSLGRVAACSSCWVAFGRVRQGLEQL